MSNDRAEILRDLVVNGSKYDPARLRELAAELDLAASDIFVIAGHSVPDHLLPPEGDGRVVREFTYRVTYCDHAQLTALEAFVSSLASASPASAADVPRRAAPPGTSGFGVVADGFGTILEGLMRNRGLGRQEMPFTGLSISTINGMVGGRWHNMQQLKAMAGPLGWRIEDLVVVAGEPLETTVNDCSVLCRHVGKVYVAAIPLTTEQVKQAAVEADRLSGRADQGAWRPVATKITSCPYAA